MKNSAATGGFLWSWRRLSVSQVVHFNGQDDWELEGLRISAFGERPLPRDPQTIDFSTPILNVSIWASGGGQATTFRMDAFDSGGGLVGTVTGGNVVGGTYGQLSLASLTAPASRVVLTQTGTDNAFVYDDLEFTFIPEPAMLGALPLGLLILRRARRA